MRSSIAKALSILGVVAAGSAATAINTQALQSRANATVGDATALLAPKSASVPTPTITIFKTATPVVAGPVAPTNIGGPDSNNGITKNSVTTEPVNNAQPSQSGTKVKKPAADETSNRQSAPKVMASPTSQISHTSTGGSSYTSGDNEDAYGDTGKDNEDSNGSEDREDNNGGDSDDD